LRLRDAEAVAEAAERGKVPVLAGHLLVHHPVVEQLQALVQGGVLGQVYYLYGLRVNLGQVRADENALWSFGPHDVAVALFLLGAVPQRVAAQGRCYLQPDIEDVVFVTMDFASGTLAHVQLSWLDPHKVRKLTIVGSKQMAVFDDMEPREKLRLYDKGVDRPPEYASYGESLTIREGDIFIPKIPTIEPLAAELGHFVRVARGAETPRAGPADGVRVVRVLEAASRSIAAGGTPVSLGPLPPPPRPTHCSRRRATARPCSASWAWATSACRSPWSWPGRATGYSASTSTRPWSIGWRPATRTSRTCPPRSSRGPSRTADSRRPQNWPVSPSRT
jgi:predicted dehydrogenase